MFILYTLEMHTEFFLYIKTRTNIFAIYEYIIILQPFKLLYIDHKTLNRLQILQKKQ